MTFAVCVTFRLTPGAAPRFLPLMKENAHLSLECEEGCHRFDVLTDPERPEEVFLYELYTDRATFDAHLDSDHFKSFDAATAQMIAEKAVVFWPEVAP